MELDDGNNNYSSFSKKPNIKRKTKTYFGDFFYKTNCPTSDDDSMTQLRNNILKNIENKYEKIKENIKKENIENSEYLTNKHDNDKFIFEYSVQEGIIDKRISNFKYKNRILDKLKDHDINDDVLFFYNFILL